MAIITGTIGPNTITGTGSADAINALSGNGNDALRGDGLWESGNDRLVGGSGADRFEVTPFDNDQFSAPYGSALRGGGGDVVTDFVRGTGKLFQSV